MRPWPAVDDLLHRGPVSTGELAPGFRSWGLDADAAAGRLRELWVDPDLVMRPGDVCWLATTPAGDALADRLHEGEACPV